MLRFGKTQNLLSSLQFSDLNVENGAEIVKTRKYPLRGYFLSVLTHTTALDRHWGGDETLTMWS